MEIINKKKIISENKLRPFSLIAGLTIGGACAMSDIAYSSLEEFLLISLGGLGTSLITSLDKIAYNLSQDKEKWEKDANLINSGICLTNYTLGAITGYYGTKILKSVGIC